MVRFVISLAMGLCLAASAYAEMYASSYIGSSGPATLYLIDSTTGAATPVGAIGFTRVGALDFAPGGTLYGVGTSAGTTVLLTINTATGAGTVVGSLGLGGTAIQDIAFRNDGVLFAYATGNIYTINTTTGAATLVGATGGGFPDGNGLAFQGGTLFLGNDGGGLQTINQATGAATAVAPLTYGAGFAGGDRPPGMKFDPGSGVLYAAIAEGFPATATFLGVIDVATGNVTEVGPTVLGVDAIAISPRRVPALSKWPLLALIAMVLAVGLVLPHRRRVRNQ